MATQKLLAVDAHVLGELDSGRCDHFRSHDEDNGPPLTNRKEVQVRKALCLFTTFVVAAAIGFGLAGVVSDEAQAKPNDCLLYIEPFYYCVESNACKGPGEMKCWLCQGMDMYDEPCLCTRMGCMVPPN